MFKDRFKGVNLPDQRSNCDTGGFASQRSIGSGIFHQIQELASNGGILNRDNKQILDKFVGSAGKED